MSLIDSCVLSDTGTRSNLEDRYSLYLNNKKGLIFGGVYDGHGGVDVAENASRIIPKEVIMNARSGVNIKDAFKNAFKAASSEGRHLHIGSTALAFLITGEKLFVANAGDCRMLLLNNKKDIQLTTDHRVTNKDEFNRLKAAGATIKDNRVFCGEIGINISRALGNLSMKKAGVIAEPDVRSYKLPPQYILIAATDGLWCYLKNEQVREIVNFELSAKEICRELIRVVKLRSLKYKYLDNTTLIVLKKNGQP